MREEDSTFGTEPQHLDRLIALGLEDDAEEAAKPPGSRIEGPGGWVGRYRLLQVLGEGGMGIVYLAEQRDPVRRQVALKILKPGMDSKRVLARFETEQQALALMEHPCIARVYDAGLAPNGRPYFVMEHVKGLPINVHCDQYRLTIEQRLRLFLHVCSAVQHAHQKGIIHRDLKPSNILVVLQDQEMIPKVIDFGVARAISQPLTERTLFTEQGQLVGTPEYTSPEQANIGNQDVDTRTDIYSLGVILYELLAGVLPFDPQTFRTGGIEHVRKVICEQEPKTPSTQFSRTSAEEFSQSAQRRQTDVRSLQRKLHGDLDWITLRAMEKDRMRRYQTAHALAEDIERHLNNEPVSAGRPGPFYRFQKLVRRNKRVFAAAAVVAAVLVLGALVSTWQAVRATAAKREQSRIRQQAEAQAYAANMNLAQQAWEQNNVSRMRQLLEETAAYPGRGFEWYYWQRQAHLELRTLRGHLNTVLSVAFSPDGRRIVTGSEDQTARVWNAASGMELFPVKGHRSFISSVAFSPDGRRIITGSEDQTATVWDAASAKELFTVRHDTAIASVAFSPDGQRIVTGSDDRTARVWDAATGDRLHTLEGHSGWVRSVAFSTDGQRIVTGSDDRTAKVWEAASGKLVRTLTGHNARIFSVAFSPDDRRIVTGGEDRTARVWDAATGTLLFPLTGHGGKVSSVAFSPDGQRIATGSEDRTAKVWDAATGKELLTLEGHTGSLRSVAFSPDGRRIVTGSHDQTAKIWTQDNEFVSLEGQVARIRSVAVSPDGRRIVTGGDDQTARVWEIASGKELLTLTGHSAPIRAVAFSPDGQRVVTGSDDLTVRVWEAATGHPLAKLEGHRAAPWSVASSADNRQIVAGGDDQTVKVWDAASGKLVLNLTGHSAAIRSVAFSPDGRQIASGSLDRTANVWDAATGNRLLTLKGHTDAVWSVAFSPDGQRIVTGSEDRTARVWDAAMGKPVLLPLRGHSGLICSAAFSPDGQRIITGSCGFTVADLPSSYPGGGDQTAKVWEAISGRELLDLKGHSATMWSVRFSTDGQHIVAASCDQTAKMWQAASPPQVDAWQQEEETAKGRIDVARREQDALVEQERVQRAQDPGALRQWLILAPIRFAEPNGTAVLDREQIAAEGQLRPGPWQRVRVGDRELTWRQVPLADYLIDFNQLLGGTTNWSVAYAVSYVQSETARSGLLLKVGRDDEAKVYINGKEVYRGTGQHTYVADEDVVPGVELNVGLNVVVFKVVNELGGWQGSVRFTDAAGQPVKGIRATLDPEKGPER